MRKKTRYDNHSKHKQGKRKVKKKMGVDAYKKQINRRKGKKMGLDDQRKQTDAERKRKKMGVAD